MDAFLKAVTHEYSAYLGTASGNVWRVWFGPDNQPMIELCPPDQVREINAALIERAKLP